MAINYYKYTVITIIIVMLGTYAIAELDTNDLDEICNTNNNLLKRITGNWTCTQTHFAEMWGRDVVNTTINNPNEYVNISNLENYTLLGITYQNSKLNITKTATYKTTAQISFSGGANNEYHLAQATNGIRDGNCHAERKLGNGGDVGSTSITCINQLTKGDIITLMIENTDSDKDALFHSITFNIMEIT